MLSIVSEIIRYVQRFKDTTIVVMLENNIIRSAEELGLIDDLCTIKRAGINVVVAHNYCKFNLKKWERAEYVFCDFGYNIPIDFVQQENIPVFKVECNKDFSCDMLIAEAAVELQARKFIMVTNHKGVFRDNKLISEISISEATKLLAYGVVHGRIKKQVEAAIFACKEGINRVHIISGQEQHSLLVEIFSHEGTGTMFYDKIPYKIVCRATLQDIATIRSIISAKFPISNIQIRKDIQSYYVVDIDGDIAGCMKVSEGTGGVSVTFMLNDESHDQGSILKILTNYLVELYTDKRILFDLAKNSVWIAIYPWFKKSGFRKVARRSSMYVRE